MRARVAKYPPRTTFHTASPRNTVNRPASNALHRLPSLTRRRLRKIRSVRILVPHEMPSAASMPTKAPRYVPRGRGPMAASRLLSVSAKKNHATSVIPRANMVTSKNATTLSGETHLLRCRDLATPSTAPTTRAGNNSLSLLVVYGSGRMDADAFHSAPSRRCSSLLIRHRHTLPTSGSSTSATNDIPTLRSTALEAFVSARVWATTALTSSWAKA
jgi:hypothetical protein